MDGMNALQLTDCACSITCIDGYIAVSISMLLLLYSLLGILGQTLEDAFENTLFGEECSANIVSLEQLDLQVPMKQHHVTRDLRPKVLSEVASLVACGATSGAGAAVMWSEVGRQHAGAKHVTL